MGKGILKSRHCAYAILIKPRHFVYAPVIVIVVLVAYKCAETAKPTPLADVYDVCAHCGMTPDEITGIIESIRASSGNLSRQESLALYHATFDDDDVKPDRAIKSECDDCANAVLDLVYGGLAETMKEP